MTSLQILPLTGIDIPRAMEFVTAAGWNQTPATWSRFINYHPDGCFKAVHEGRMVGTVTSICYGQQLAWIGMMLVDPDMQRMGIGRALMERVIGHLRDRGLQTIKLDATPMGKLLYEKLAFNVECEFSRWRREAVESEARPLSPVSFQSLDERLRQLDTQAFGVDRFEWLKQAAIDGQVTIDADGFGMLRIGRLNDYLGPMTAATFEAARGIVERLCQATSKSILWDIPKVDTQAYELARSLGFAPLRPLTRMVLGTSHIEPQMHLQWAICDPASG